MLSQPHIKAPEAGLYSIGALSFAAPKRFTDVVANYLAGLAHADGRVVVGEELVALIAKAEGVWPSLVRRAIARLAKSRRIEFLGATDERSAGAWEWLS